MREVSDNVGLGEGYVGSFPETWIDLFSYHIVLLGSSKVETFGNTPKLDTHIQRTLFGEYFLIEPSIMHISSLVHHSL